ncbi:hypothetical protein [Stenotrophomonas maltophilia]|uniref:hypothetical protein n=1 Tax=Stenotrophomonas maltophilia TaxID=40324 RepID=UPI00118157FC|nr:hypothetical protein [Stenotrophomonas maltophilia]
MKKKLSIAIAVLLCASTTAHAQQIKEGTLPMPDGSEAVSIANANTAKCKIILGSKEAVNNYQLNDKYDHLPLCKRNLNLEDLEEEKTESDLLILQEERSVIL